MELAHRWDGGIGSQRWSPGLCPQTWQGGTAADSNGKVHRGGGWAHSVDMVSARMNWQAGTWREGTSPPQEPGILSRWTVFMATGQEVKRQRGSLCSQSRICPWQPGTLSCSPRGIRVPGLFSGSHGNQFGSLQSLGKPGQPAGRRVRGELGCGGLCCFSPAS